MPASHLLKLVLVRASKNRSNRMPSASAESLPSFCHGLSRAIDLITESRFVFSACQKHLAQFKSDSWTRSPSMVYYAQRRAMYVLLVLCIHSVISFSSISVLFTNQAVLVSNHLSHQAPSIIICISSPSSLPRNTTNSGGPRTSTPAAFCLPSITSFQNPAKISSTVTL